MGRPRKIKIDGDNNEIMPKREFSAFQAGKKVEAEVLAPETRNAERPARIPMHNSVSIFEHEEIPGFKLRWTIDEEGKLKRYEAAYWEHVFEHGQKVTRVAGNGQTHYLMKLEIHLWEKDRLEERERNENRSKSIINPGSTAIPGLNNANEIDSNYILKDRHSVVKDVSRDVIASALRAKERKIV